MTAGTASGRAAYEAWWRTAKGAPRPPDVSYDEDREAWDAAASASVRATPLYAELAGQLAEVNGYHTELVNEVLLNAGDEFDDDAAADVIAVSYVRHLEQREPVAVVASRDSVVPELAAAMAESRQLRERVAILLAEMPRELWPAWAHEEDAAVNPAAEDYDNAAEILRLRDQLAVLAKEILRNADPEEWDVDNDASAVDYVRRMEAAYDELREQLAVARERLENLAAGLEMSARTSQPSKKSEIEQGCAAAVRGIAEGIEAGQ